MSRSHDDDWPPRGLDLSKASSARVYDYLLGGKDNFAIDREAGERIKARMPGAHLGVQAQRAVLGRVVRFLVREVGLRQLVDIGTGLPTVDNVHQVARSVAPGVRVAYVDNDPIVLSHARALLATDDDTLVVEGDLNEPAALLTSLDDHIDLSEPVGLILCGILHHIQDDPWSPTAKLVAALAPGSYVFVHHLFNRGDEQSAALQALERSRYRTYEEISRFFTGLDLVEPGLVPVPEWRPDPELAVLDDHPVLQLALAGVARKP